MAVRPKQTSYKVVNQLSFENAWHSASFHNICMK